MFDVNCFDQLASFLPAANRAPLVRLEARSDLPYRFTVITNVARDSERMAQRTNAPRSSAIDSTALAVAWPPGVFSLTHVAVPFSSDDQVYGANENANSFLAVINPPKTDKYIKAIFYHDLT